MVRKIKKRRTTKYYRKREREIIMKSGGKPVPASGAGAQKSDGKVLGDRGYTWRQELKSTDADYFRITKKIIRKLNRESASCGGEPMLIIDFIQHDRLLYVFPEYMIEKYTDVALDGDTVDPWTAWRYIDVDETRYCILPRHLALPLLRLDKR